MVWFHITAQSSSFIEQKTVIHLNNSPGWKWNSNKKFAQIKLNRLEMTVASVPNRKPCNVKSSRNAETGWDLNLGQTLQQSPLVCSVYDSDRYKTTMSFWSTLANNLCVSLFTLDVRQDAGSRQSDGWSEDLLTGNNIFQKQLESSFFFGPWQTVFMCWIPKHLVINYGVDNVLCCLICF